MYASKYTTYILRSERPKCRHLRHLKKGALRATKFVPKDLSRFQLYTNAILSSTWQVKYHPTMFFFYHLFRDYKIYSRIYFITFLFTEGSSHNWYYCSFKIFPRFWLVKTTRTIRHKPAAVDQDFCHIEPMTSKMQPAADLLNHWRQRLLSHWPRKPGDEVVFFKTERNGCEYVYKFERRKYFDWVIKQLLNSAFVRYEEIFRSRRVLFTSAFDLGG